MSTSSSRISYSVSIASSAPSNTLLPLRHEYHRKFHISQFLVHITIGIMHRYLLLGDIKFGAYQIL
ncbi:hypothetical protein BJY00DRAFT_285223 [Aspergillus carlsbadensis]|nr:hypothetical protein BJY00DRAFT_285223 [Aspergillus carlsbadensis]